MSETPNNAQNDPFLDAVAKRAKLVDERDTNTGGRQELAKAAAAIMRVEAAIAGPMIDTTVRPPDAYSGENSIPTWYIIQRTRMVNRKSNGPDAGYDRVIDQIGVGADGMLYGTNKFAYFTDEDLAPLDFIRTNEEPGTSSPVMQWREELVKLVTGDGFRFMMGQTIYEQ